MNAPRVLKTRGVQFYARKDTFTPNSVVRGFESLNTGFTHLWFYTKPQGINKNRSTSSVGGFVEICAPTGIRTPVVALKGLRPSPLDDGGKLLALSAVEA